MLTSGSTSGEVAAVAQPYLVINEHSPEECELLEPGFHHLPEHLVGVDFYCPCPYGEHGFYMVVEGESSEQVIERLPPEFRPGTRAVAIEIFPLSR